jgi:2-amino-4-hydroxy-6-hydroxymethyldihydropteridine diphosphokinase
MRAYLSLGSNMGDRGAYLALGVAEVAASDPYELSSVYETEPVGGVVQDAFWNLVIKVETDASPEALLERCRTAERRAQRARRVRWGPRTLDADVLLVGDHVRESDELTVPHPRMWERNFVLVPLQELGYVLGPEHLPSRAVGEVRRLGTLSSLR